MKGIGIFGGTFDPIHSGHLIVAEEVWFRLELDYILFIPAGQPWLKVNRVITPAVHRLAMLKLAIASNPGFQFSALEIDHPGASYTVDTLRSLRAQLGREVKLFFILGWDNLNELPQWHEPSELVKLCTLVAVPRLDCPKPDLDSLDKAVPGVASKTILIDTPFIGISSSEIRQRIAEGKSIRYLVPQEVERYIREHRLYCEPTT